MGYTRYWNRTEKKITSKFVIAVAQVIADCDEKGILIRNGYGEGNPVVTMNEIWINGNRETNLDHETLRFDNNSNNVGFNFCKTARKPYDYAVREILKIAEEMGMVTNVSSDGENDEIISDEEYLKREG